MINTHNYLGKRLNLCSNWYSVFIVYGDTVIYKRLFGAIVVTKPSHVLPKEFQRLDDKRIQDIVNKTFDGKL